MQKRRIYRMAAAAALLLLVFASYASADDWVLLGTRTVALSGDVDEIVVTASEGTFKALQLKVRDKGVQFEKVVVVFRNGRTAEAVIRDLIPAGGSTRVFDLPGNERIIRKIILHYTTRPGTLDRAVVEAWGLRD